MSTVLAILLAAGLFALAAWLRPKASCSEHCNTCLADCVLKTGEHHE